MNTNQSARFDGGGVNLREIAGKCISNWYWFLISLVVCIGLAALYIVKTPKIYTRSATVLIKETAVRRTSNDLESMLSAGGMTQQSSKLSNEIIALQSPDLMREVVTRMGLDFDYFVSGRARRHVIYGASLPIKAEFLEPAPRVSMEVIPLSASSFKMEMHFQDTKESKNYRGNFGDTLSTAVGRLVISSSGTGAEFDTPIFVEHYTLQAATSSYNSRLSASALNAKNYSDILSLTITDQSPRRAEDVLDMVINVYNENWVDDRNKMAVSTSLFIDDRLKAIETDLGAVDSDISSFKSRYVVPDVAAAASMYMSQTQEAGRQIQDLDNQLYTARYIRTSMSTAEDLSKPLPSPPGLTNINISTQIGRYNDMVIKRNNIVANSSDKNPLVQELDTNLRDLRSSIFLSIDDLINTLQAQKANIEKAEQKATSRLADNPKQTNYLLSVERQQKVKEALYIFLLQKREENELSQAFTAYNTRVITKPTGSPFPTSPNTKQILMLAFMMGIMLPLILIYISLVADTKIRNRKDLEVLSAPFLGEVPLHGKKKSPRKDGETPELVVESGKRDAVNEAFRVCRTNIEFIARGSYSKVMIVTSFNPGSGKTFVTSNLGAALAIKGNKVLLIDGDLRHCSLSSVFGRPKNGLSDYLSMDGVDLESIIVHPQGYGNLSVLPVGTVPPNPSELVGSEKFQELLDAVKDSYDYVFVDCPPYNVVADTQIIAQWADRSIFVVRSGRLEKDMLAELEGLCGSKKLKDLSVLLNATELNAGRSGYGYGYGYHGYDYYSQKN